MKGELGTRDSRGKAMSGLEGCVGQGKIWIGKGAAGNEACHRMRLGEGKEGGDWGSVDEKDRGEAGGNPGRRAARFFGGIGEGKEPVDVGSDDHAAFGEHGRGGPVGAPEDGEGVAGTR